MVQALESESPFEGRCVPHVLVVERDTDYGQLVVAELQTRSIRAKHTSTVDAFLDLNCRERVDLVSLEIDALDPHALENIQLLRTHFGEGPGTRIVASSSFMPGAFPTLLEQRGADICLSKLRDPKAMATELEAEIQKHLKAADMSQANKLGRTDP